VEFWQQAVVMVRDKQTAGCLILSENCEEFLRISMTVALDLVAANNPSTSDDGRWPAHLPMVNLYDWLTRLYGKLPLAQEHEELFKESWVNFTHFVRFGEHYTHDNPFGRHHLLQLWSRQGAGIGTLNQADWNKIVPFYRGGLTPPNLDDKFDPNKLHCLLIQDKKHFSLNSNWYAADSQKTIDLKPSTPDANWKPNPSIFLFVDLASKTRTMYHEGKDKQQGTLYIYLGGSDIVRYPFLKGLGANAIEAMVGMLGPHISAIKRANKAPVGSQGWRDMHWEMATQGLLGEE
jgi:hypothetical protein